MVRHGDPGAAEKVGVIKGQGTGTGYGVPHLPAQGLPKPGIQQPVEECVPYTAEQPGPVALATIAQVFFPRVLHGGL